MKATSNSRINREQQVKVVIRLKPQDPQNRQTKCVYLSDHENELVVETDNKKQIFVFDHIAPQNCSQMDIYRMIGQQVVQMSFEGYNCCLFAYGQTGAGKTYSVMGNLLDLNSDYYSDSRGLLPRIIEDVFDQSSNQNMDKCRISCSFMEVYNEQIFDLLSSQKRIHQIRQDLKRGVFVEGLTQKKITSYKQAMELILEGQKTRKMASTAMNTESSRSHAIFTILIQSQITEDDIVKVRKSKLNIVDLAGSQRVKHTHVMGEQLKQGCNINKSLHVLGNVINSLVQSAKKKKHIPFRDSKLTHYLKDSLGGNSITKLLANIHTNKLFLGDTLSTLMFAKRAKILKTKIQVNQNITQNFESLRKQVKRLRQQLAQARYFKGQTQRTQGQSYSEDSEAAIQKIPDNGENVIKNELMNIFQQNELNYKSLMEIYEQHHQICNIHNLNNKSKHQFNMVSQWKNLQKKNIALTSLVRKMPAFSKIYKQNVFLREQIQKINAQNKPSSQQQKSTNQAQMKNDSINSEHIEQIIDHYETIIEEIRTKFESALATLQKNFIQLEHECKIKDKRLRQFMKNQNVQPEVQDLKNQNQYLHLNILNLQNQICKFQQNQHKIQLQQRQLKRHSHKKNNHNNHFNEDGLELEETQYLLNQLQAIKAEALKQMELIEQERVYTDNIIQELKKKINLLTVENTKLQMKHSRTRSHIKQERDIFESRASSINYMKTSFTDLFLAEQSQIFELSKKSQSQWEQQIKRVQESHKQELCSIKQKIQQKQKQISLLKEQIISSKDVFKIEEQFGKSLKQILNQYRQSSRKNMSSRSMINIHELKQSNLKMPQVKIQQKPQKKINSSENKILKSKEPPKPKKQELLSVRNSQINAKKQYVSSK